MAHIFGSIWDRFNRNALNDLSKSVEQQGKSIQDLVAEGQLTEEQYAKLINIVNANVKSGEVSKFDLQKNLRNEIENKRNKDVPISLNDASTELLAAIEGGGNTSFNLLSEPRRRSVTHEKTNFIKVGSNNLYNKEDITLGYTMDENGVITENTSFSYSSYIPISGGTGYRIGGGANRIIFFDENREYISGVNGSSSEFWSASSPANAYFAVIVTREPFIQTTQLNEGSEVFPYDEYFTEVYNTKISEDAFKPQSVTEAVIKDGAVSEGKVSFIESSTNIFDKNSVVKEKIISDDGTETSNIYYTRSEYIIIKNNTNYTFKGVSSIALYTKDKEFMSRVDISEEHRGNYTHLIPKNVAYIIVNVQTSAYSLSEVQINEGNTLLPYEPYYTKLSDKIRVEGATGTGEKTVYINVPNEGISYFGIDGNGVSDDTQGLKDYLYSLKENGGGEMSLPNGTYLINGTLEVPSNVIISGQGNSTLFKLGDNHDLTGRLFRGERISRPYIVTEENSENVYFRDFKVLGNTNIFEDALHHAVAFMDTVGGGLSNVSTGYINYDPGTADLSDLMGFNVAFIRAKEVRMTGGKHEYGGYENVGFEFAEDIIVDGIFSGDAWRTSYQLHQGNKNIKTINSTIRQTLETADAAMTLHARGGGGESDDLTFSNNTVLLQASGGAFPYMGTVQMFGPHKKASFLGNTIKGQKNGIYNLNTAELMIANDNIIEAETGIALRFDGPGIANGNFVKTKSGMTPFEKAEGSNVVGSGNIGFDIV